MEFGNFFADYFVFKSKKAYKSFIIKSQAFSILQATFFDLKRIIINLNSIWLK